MTCDNCGQVKTEVIEVDKFNIYNNEVLSLKLREDAVPIAFQCRTLPQAQEEKVKAELQRMIDKGMTVPVREATQLSSHMLVCRKAESSAFAWTLVEAGYDTRILAYSA